MKTIIATLVTMVGLIALPNKAEALSPKHCGSSYTYRSGHASCGCAIYTKRIVIGYDCYRRPIYRYCSVPIVHRCHTKRKHYYGYHGHHNKYSHRNRHYSHYGNHRYRYGSRISFSTGYGGVRICR